MWRAVSVERVVDEHGRPLAGLVVGVPDASTDGLLRPVGRTDAHGRPRLDGDVQVPHDAQLMLSDALGLRPVAPLTSSQGAPSLVVPRAKALGWLAASDDAQPAAVTQGNEVELLVDDEVFAAIARAVRRARSSIRLSQLLFDPDFIPVFGGGTSGRALADDLVAAARRGVEVRLLLNENAVVPDDVDAMRRRFLDAPRSRLLAVPMSPNVFHAKVLIVDNDEAFVIGPPFRQDYWDEWRHAVDDARRGSRHPLHDVSIRIRGPAVAGIDAFFVDVWNAYAARAELEDAARIAALPAPPPAGGQTLHLVRTVPAAWLPNRPAPDRGIREAYLRMFANAQRYAYLETQYFTSRTIVRAIDNALARTPQLEVIILLNVDTDVPGYVAWQKRRFEELGYPGRERLGVFALWRHAPRDEKPALLPVYVHSKVAIADDAWATVGTANLDSASLEVPDEFGVRFDSNVDLNVVLPDGVEGAPATGAAAHIRRRLWSEHLGDDGIWDAAPAPGGWLDLWRRIAQENLWRIERGDGDRLTKCVLPYDPERPHGS